MSTDNGTYREVIMVDWDRCVRKGRTLLCRECSAMRRELCQRKSDRKAMRGTP